jgi:predicted transcriptional regulator
MAAPKRSKIQRERDRVTISELYLKGWSQSRIGEFLEIDQSSVSRELKKIKAAWKEESVRDYDLHVQEQLHRLSAVESEYWAGWERSQVAREQTLTEKLTEAVEGGSRVKAQKRSETRVGDPKFLEGLLKCIEQRAKLLDLYPRESSTSASQIQLSEGQLSVIGSLMNERHAIND